MALEIRREIEKLGARFDESVNNATRRLFAGRAEINTVSIEVRDLAYGSHERNRIDLFSAGGENLPVVLFVHGGGFNAGDKRSTDDFYANVGRYFASRGFLGVTMNYRLSSTDSWPSGQDDLAAAMRWLSVNAHRHGGDPSRVGLVGQSAGCCHIAGYLFGQAADGALVHNVRAAALMSGYYAVKPPLAPGHLAYFGADDRQYRERSPVTHVARNAVPLLLTIAEFDLPQYARQTLEFAIALTQERGVCPRLQWLGGHNHVSNALSLGSVQDDVGAMLAEFFGWHLGVHGETGAT